MQGILSKIMIFPQTGEIYVIFDIKIYVNVIKINENNATM